MLPCLFTDLELADIPPSIRFVLKAAAFVLLFFLVRLFISNKNLLCTSEVCLLEDLHLSWFQLRLNHNTTLLNMAHIYGTMWMVNIFMEFMGTSIMREHQKVSLVQEPWSYHIMSCTWKYVRVEQFILPCSVFHKKKEQIKKCRTNEFYWVFCLFEAHCLYCFLFLIRWLPSAWRSWNRRNSRLCLPVPIPSSGCNCSPLKPEPSTRTLSMEIF